MKFTKILCHENLELYGNHCGKAFKLVQNQHVISIVSQLMR